MHVTCLVCTLKRSPEPSNAESLAEVVLDALRAESLTTDEKDWSISTGKACAKNLLRTARALQ